MRKKDLMATKKLYATPSMIMTAEENLIKTVQTTASWGMKTTRSKCKYGRYFRAGVEAGILKVAVFTQWELQNGNRAPLYEIYCDKEKSKWSTYEPGEDKWRTAKIDMLEYPRQPYLYECQNWQQDKDRKIVNDYFNTGQNRDIYAAVLDFQSTIRADQLRRKHRSELEEIDEVMREVPDIPKNFNDWIAKNCFKETMFYEPESMCHYSWPRMYCTHCRKWMDTQSYPNRPEHNKEAKCPSCGAAVTYRSWNKQKYVTDETDVGLLQRLTDDSGWILRGFHCKITRRHDLGWNDYELSVHEDTRVRLDEQFIEREFFEYGEYKHTGVTRWCHECRRSQWGYYCTKSFGRVVMYTPNLKRELKREAFAGMDLKKVMKGGEHERVEPVFILRKLKQHPYIEYMQKSGLSVLVDEIMRNEEDLSLFAGTEIRIHDVLKLEKQRFQRMKKLNGGSRTLRALQYEQATGQKVTDENIKFIEGAGVDVKEVIDVSERTGMNLQRTLNYLQKQMELTGQRWMELYRHYTDYLDMAAVFGMDITDEIVCRQPKLMEYHDRYAERKNRHKNKTRDAEVDLKYPNIKANVSKFKERFAFETEELEIVVPQTASDITKEGRKQHHCVGASDTYIRNMDQERYFILFLRKRSNLKKPYYTLEVTWDGEIRQFYAAYDRQPDKEEVKKVLDEFTREVQKREQELEKKMHEIEARDNTKATRVGNKWIMVSQKEAM